MLLDIKYIVYTNKLKRLNQYMKSSFYKPLSFKKKNNQFKLKKCPKCKCVWELHYQTNLISRYFDFPAYGLKKEICNECNIDD